MKLSDLDKLDALKKFQQQMIDAQLQAAKQEYISDFCNTKLSTVTDESLANTLVATEIAALEEKIKP